MLGFEMKIEDCLSLARCIADMSSITCSTENRYANFRCCEERAAIIRVCANTAPIFCILIREIVIIDHSVPTQLEYQW